MRLVILLGVLGLAFVAFGGQSLFDGKGRDGIESIAAGIVMLGCAFLLGRRYLPSRGRRLDRAKLLGVRK